MLKLECKTSKIIRDQFLKTGFASFILANLIDETPCFPAKCSNRDAWNNRLVALSINISTKPILVKLEQKRSFLFWEINIFSEWFDYECLLEYVNRCANHEVSHGKRNLAGHVFFFHFLEIKLGKHVNPVAHLHI